MKPNVAVVPLVDVGPDAPTLCGDWTTRDLAAHLVVRDRRPDAAPGLVTSFMSGYTEHVRATEAERPYWEIVDRVRKGPPHWSPLRIEALDRLANSLEFFVHHEDVRRAQPGAGRPPSDRDARWWWLRCSPLDVGYRVEREALVAIDDR